MEESWEILIDRAKDLASKRSETSELLTFYERLLSAQKQIYKTLRDRRGWLPSGVLVRDMSVIRPELPIVLEVARASGPASLAEEALSLEQASEAEITEMLLEYWHEPSDVLFFAKALLQPYARWLIEAGGVAHDRNLQYRENRCPFCAGKPQLSVLQTQGDDSEGGNRSLLCSTCLSQWPFRRVVCASCGEEHPAKLSYFHTTEYDHVRIEACETCKHYLKGIDLTRFGLAAPLVDEVAAAALDLWARERGWIKIELNLVGL